MQTSTAAAGVAVKRKGGFACQLGMRPLVGTGNLGELHIAMEGRWDGHPEGGFEFTQQVFDDMIAKFRDQKTPIFVDYEHSAPIAGDTRAAGWIHGLEKRRGPDGWELWAKPVEWTDSAAEMIRAGEYRFCSPWFALESTDRRSGDEAGPRLLNVALTNMPFLDGQQPIRLSFIAAMQPGKMNPEQMQQEHEEQPPAQPPQQQQPPAAPPPPEQDADRVMAEQLGAFIDAIAKAAGINRAAAVAALNEMSDQLGGMVRDQLDRDGMPSEEPMIEPEKKDPPAADPEQKRKDEIEASAKENAGAIALSQIADLTKRVEAAEAKQKQAEEQAKAKLEADNKAQIDEMVKCGALLEKEREDATWLLSSDPKRFASIYADRKGLGKKVPIGVRQASAAEPIDPATAKMSDLDPHEQRVCSILVGNGYSAERALKRVLEDRAKKAG